LSAISRNGLSFVGKTLIWSNTNKSVSKNVKLVYQGQGEIENR